MLVQTVLPPQLFTLLPSDLYGQKLFCNLWLGLLFDFSANCIILLPGNHSTPADYLTAISAWPPKYKKRAMELMTILKNRQRLIPSQTNYLPATNCSDIMCQPFVGMSNANPHVFHITNERCTTCLSATALASRSVDGIDYFTSNLSHRLSENLSYVLGDGQWTQIDFEREILEPVLATTKHIKIYDRYIGRTQLKTGYKKTIEWIVQIFQKVGGAARGGVFEVYTGIKDKPSTLECAKIRRRMQTFATNLHTNTGIQVKIILKDETTALECPHGRYLVTDQTSIVIDRGFDLFWSDNKMVNARMNPLTDPRPIRDVAVLLCNDCSQVDSQTRTLPPF